MTTYSISLDDLDLALLPLRTQQHSGFLKKEHFEFQVMKTDIVEEPEPTILYTCHICAIKVPAAFAREHAASVKHRANARIASIAAERTRALITALPPPVAQSTARFCANCATTVGKNHEKTKEHRVAVMHDKLLWELMTAYVGDDDDDVSNYDSDDSDTDLSTRIEKSSKYCNGFGQWDKVNGIDEKQKKCDRTLTKIETAKKEESEVKEGKQYKNNKNIDGVTKVSDKTGKIQSSSNMEKTNMIESSSNREKTSMIESSSDREKTSTIEPSSDREKTSAIEPSSDRDKTSMIESSSDREKTSAIEPSSDREKTSAIEPSSDRERTSTIEPSSDREKTSAFESSTDREKNEMNTNGKDKETEIRKPCTDTKTVTNNEEIASTSNPKPPQENIKLEYVEFVIKGNKQVKVFSDYYHSFTRKVDTINCKVCSSTFKNSEIDAHMFSLKHLNKMPSTIIDEHCVRQINDVYSHCILCNQMVKNSNVTKHYLTIGHGQREKQAVTDNTNYNLATTSKMYNANLDVARARPAVDVRVNNANINGDLKVKPLNTSEKAKLDWPVIYPYEVTNQESTVRCVICDCQVPNNPDNRKGHLIGSNHAKNVKNKRVSLLSSLV